ncbi:E3 ubiquitin-protein ligase TRIM45-like isoform X2 [Montipora foliosa]|uniref:E3 ubiquitin-protein ligase TRIM45-like isoform X2 n=1 Tax=Montipora foliosa TaxID=591990 RepID=UPI0035F1AE63
MASAIPDKHLECAVCMEQFKEPKVLPCLHTYCKVCLEKLIKKQGSEHVITCPECRQETKIADGNVSKLQPNFWINNFMTLLNIQSSTSSGNSVTCEQCDGGDSAGSRCMNCRVFMCKFCETAHRRMNTFKGHQILSLAEVQKLGSKALVKPAFCGKHAGEALKLFCETCQETICRDCTIIDHREHKYNFIADVSEREREIVQAILRETKTKENAVEKGLFAVEAMAYRVAERIAEVNKEVDVFFDEQVKALENMRKKLKSEVEDQGEVKLTELGSQMEALILSLAQLKSGVEFAERALAEGDDTELLAMKQPLVERLSQLNALQYQCKPCKSDYFALQMNKTVLDIGEMVTLLHEPVDPTKYVLSMVGGEEGILYQTLAGQPVDFSLFIKDEPAGSIPLASRSVRASVTHSRDANLHQELPVEFLDGRSYSFSYVPDTEGVCTLSVTVEEVNVCGSPLTWKVKPEVTHDNQIYLLTSAERHESGRGQHCWKLKFENFGKQRSAEIGVRCFTPANGVDTFFDVETRRCTWCCSVKGYNHIFCSRSDNPRAASITSILVGDIFSLYLNYDTKKLVVYNHRSKETEIFTDVNGRVIRPIILPSCGYRDVLSLKRHDPFTLDI